MTESVMVTVVGAGPFGLSIAAHLRSAGVAHRIFGMPMDSWRSGMPEGMQLKSAPFASMLHAPGNAFSLRHYCSLRGLPYQDLDWPVPLQVFVDYGLAFQARYVPDLELDTVQSIRQVAQGFQIITRGGASFLSRKVVLAVGQYDFKYLPAAFGSLPAEKCSHSSQHHSLAQFSGRRVAVIGGGASATDMAVLLREAGAEVQMVTRRERLEFGAPWAIPSDLGMARRLKYALRRPLSPIGRGWGHVAFSNLPDAYRLLPDHMRLHYAQTFLGPAAGWDMKTRARGLAVSPRSTPERAWLEGEQVHLCLRSREGQISQWVGDHVVCATGFRPDIERLGFLSAGLLAQIERLGTAPRLSASFESSVPGLYFAGPVTAASFGPFMRFTAATPFTARRVSAALAQGGRYRTPSWPTQGEAQWKDLT